MKKPPDWKVGNRVIRAQSGWLATIVKVTPRPGAPGGVTARLRVRWDANNVESDEDDRYFDHIPVAVEKLKHRIAANGTAFAKTHCKYLLAQGLTDENLACALTALVYSQAKALA